MTGDPGPRRVAVASRSIAGVTGTTTSILEHAKRLSALGWEVHLYGESMDRGRLESTGAVGHRVLRWPIGGGLKRRYFAWRFQSAVRRLRPDLICGHGDTLEQDILFLHNCVHAAHEAIRGTPLPERSGVGALHARQLREQRFRLLIANSRLMAEDVSRRFGVDSGKVAVIHPGYDPKRFRLEDRGRLGRPVRLELGVGASDVLVGLITSGDFAKRGVGLFLGALGRLSEEAKRRTHAVVIGSESRLGPYRRLAAQTGLGARVHFMNPASDVAPYYHALDVYAFPSFFEEFGQSVQEAMACGVPVLTSARVGASELLTGSARDMLLERPEEEAFSRRLEILIGDAELRARWGGEGTEACRGNTWDENFKKTLVYYETLAAPRRTSAAQL